ncbi:hypothetical protein F5Y01DRAFT_184432 [Xylaria sp. FL0043]|nr:hypothetical protein F5Y01DRAFT_184432 [Xylaria sp. FL0043]
MCPGEKIRATALLEVLLALVPCQSWPISGGIVRRLYMSQWDIFERISGNWLVPNEKCGYHEPMLWVHEGMKRYETARVGSGGGHKSKA